LQFTVAERRERGNAVLPRGGIPSRPLSVAVCADAAAVSILITSRYASVTGDFTVVKLYDRICVSGGGGGVEGREDARARTSS
jgi:hypothetical protein